MEGSLLYKRCRKFQEFIHMLKYLKCLKFSTKKSIYCLNGLVHTINAILTLGDDIFNNEDLGVNFILTSRFNQDPIENLFGLVRSKGGNNKNPSVHIFGFIICKILSMKFLNSSNLTNCEPDEDEFLRDHTISFGNLDVTENVSIIYEANEVSECTQAFEEDQEMQDIIDGHILQTDFVLTDASMRYFFGYIAWKVLRRTKCDLCKSFMVTAAEHISSTSERLIFYKKFSKKSDFGSLCPPTNAFFEICKEHLAIFNVFFKNKPHIINLKSTIKKYCLEKTKSNELFSDYFYESNSCFIHREWALNLLILILIRKNCKWLVTEIKSSQASRKFSKNSRLQILNS